MLSEIFFIIMLSVIKLNVVMLSVVAPIDVQTLLEGATTFSIMTFIIKGLLETLNIKDTQHK
jgi:hypothetical protein